MLSALKYIVKFTVLISLSFVSCNSIDEPIINPSVKSTINIAHFNHLYKEINFKNKKVGIVHIYSEYPDYAYAIEPLEGFTCVDDVARAVVMLSKYIEVFGYDEVIINKIHKLTEFVLQMQNQNGYFNNFIWNDLSVNTTYITSVAELNWWSFRALWALESAHPHLINDKEISGRIELASQRLLLNIKRDLPYANTTSEVINSIELPTWLPKKYASDQAAVLILGLLKNHKRTGNNDIKLQIESLAKGIMLMQKGDVDNYPYGAFLSWENLWHSWGNNQAYALLKAGQYFNNQEYINSALKEIDNFYPKIMKDGFAEAFWINKIGDKFVESNRNKYPQIAYGISPMVLASSEAFQYSNNQKYLVLAKNLALWLSGNNEANKAIYNPTTGICFDGITGPNEVNKNSGAESTIECLFILIEMEKYK